MSIDPVNSGLIAGTPIALSGLTMREGTWGTGAPPVPHHRKPAHIGCVIKGGAVSTEYGMVIYGEGLRGCAIISAICQEIYIVEVP